MQRRVIGVEDFFSLSKYWDLYKAEQIAPAPNPFHPHNTPEWTGNNSGELRSYSDIPPVGPVNKEMAMKLKHGYYACVSFMDAQVGRVLAEKSAVLNEYQHCGGQMVRGLRVDYTMACGAPPQCQEGGQGCNGYQDSHFFPGCQCSHTVWVARWGAQPKAA